MVVTDVTVDLACRSGGRRWALHFLGYLLKFLGRNIVGPVEEVTEVEVVDLAVPIRVTISDQVVEEVIVDREVEALAHSHQIVCFDLARGILIVAVKRGSEVFEVVVVGFLEVIPDRGNRAAMAVTRAEIVDGLAVVDQISCPVLVWLIHHAEDERVSFQYILVSGSGITHQIEESSYSIIWGGAK